MQIKTICLYGKNGKPRSIDFSLGSVNIITGASNRGKTSLIDIIGYCLGDTECTIKAGCIPNTVAWYSILLQVSDSQVFIARAAPLDGITPNSAAYMLIGNQLTLPKFDELSSTHRVDSIVDYLTHKLIIPQPPAGSEINTSFESSKYYLFQSQTEIANNDVLFHHQTKPKAAKAIKDTIEYYLGATDHNYAHDSKELASLRRKRNSLLKELKDINSLKGRATTTGYNLLAEAAQVGLYTGENLMPDEAILMDELTKLSQWLPNHEDDKDEFDPTPLQKLQKEYDDLDDDKKIIQLRIQEAKDYCNAEFGYSEAVEIQSYRLRSIGLFPKVQETENCPICDTNNVGQSKIDTTINNAISDLSSKLMNMSREKPKITKYINDLVAKQKSISSRQTKIRASIRKLNNANPELAKPSQREILQAKVSGQCALFIKDNSWNKDLRGHTNQIALLDEQINKLETKLDPKAIKERLNHHLDTISDDMTAWARELKLEHSSGKVRLDPKKLSVIIDKISGAHPLSNIGGGENWLGYNLVTYFALAKWFIEQARPVGNFLFLDQPSQVYFPYSSSGTGDISEIEKDEDREAVREMFLWIFKIVASLDSKLQVIITDHADINEEWFQSAIVDTKWRGDQALIPKDWISNN